uniref:Uncharacterized protein n=1 Tax=Pelagomonas calceolata TaxID=35677 RepID=A0A6S8U290_9STRA|mmetsp:Transcript_6741/g.19945  ORF Transcript_6741/g.19945 Transcript_6741/m.19945 type:complete len:276 (+) Transcript_6741:151-978(+)
MVNDDSLKKHPLEYASALLTLGEHGDWKGIKQRVNNDGHIFHGVHVCQTTQHRKPGILNRYLADSPLWAELGNVPPGVTVMVVVRGSQHKAPAADERYVHPGGRAVITQQGGNQLTKTHQSEELEKYYFEDRTNSYVIVDPARDADPNPRSYGVRVIVHCRSEVFAEEVEEEGLDVVHIITVSKCEKKNYASSTTKKKSARPAKKPRASSRGRRSPPPEPLSPATVAPPSPPSPGAKIDAALASPEAPPPAPVSSPDEPVDEPEDPMLALEYTGP